MIFTTLRNTTITCFRIGAWGHSNYRPHLLPYRPEGTRQLRIHIFPFAEGSHRLDFNTDERISPNFKLKPFRAVHRKYSHCPPRLSPTCFDDRLVLSPAEKEWFPPDFVYRLYCRPCFILNPIREDFTILPPPRSTHLTSQLEHWSQQGSVWTSTWLFCRRFPISSATVRLKL